MGNKQVNQDQPKASLVGAKAQSKLENIFSPNGNFDGRLFVSDEKVTYTYIDESEILVWHLDCEKQALYFKGHCLTHFADLESNQAGVSKFKKALFSVERADYFLKTLDKALASIEAGSDEN
ncbi:MAG: hypothetical protein H7A33_03560 [Deltaproteobacteria bacterium]|nr:hypothetical protein [Deltaproteobacteria bacterium]